MKYNSTLLNRNLLNDNIHIEKCLIFSAEQQQLLKEKTKLTLTINDLLEEVKGDNDSKKRAQQELEKLKANIAVREDELKALKPEVSKCLNVM